MLISNITVSASSGLLFYVPGNQKEIICLYRLSTICMYVRPDMHFLILHTFDRGKVPKDAEYNEVLNEPFRFLKFSGIFPVSAENPNMPQIFINKSILFMVFMAYFFL